MTGNNPVDRSKLGTKRHILTDKEGIPLSVILSSASTHDIKMVTEAVDYSAIKRPVSLSKTKNGRDRKQHLCLDKAYNSKPVEQELIKRGYVLHMPYKRERGEEVKSETQQILNHKKHPARRWVVERTNSWHNRFRKLFT